MLTDCAPDVRVFDPIGIEPLDPLSKECPDDLPCRVEDAELWFADTPSDLRSPATSSGVRTALFVTKAYVLVSRRRVSRQPTA